MGLGVLAPVASLAAPGPAPVPAAPTLLFEETFEAGLDADVVGLADFEGVQGARYTADPFWLSAEACNGLVLQSGALWTGAGEPCDNADARDRLQELAQLLGPDDSNNHSVAAYTARTGAPEATLLVRSVGSGIDIVTGRFYVASIDIAELNCHAVTDSTIAFGLELPSGDVMFDGEPAIACTQGTVTETDAGPVMSGTFFSAGFRSSESGSAEFVARNLKTDGSGNDFAYDNLRFYDATPTLHKSFSEDAVEVGEPVTMTLTVVNTSEQSEKTGWAFTDTLPEGMTVAEKPNVTSSCAAADVVAAAGSTAVAVTNGSIADGVESCTMEVDVVLSAGGEITNVIDDMDGLAGEPSSTVRALVPSMTITKTVSPESLTADTPVAHYTFTVRNDGDVALRDVAITDAGPIGGTGVFGPIDCGGVTTLAVDAELVCTADYTASPADLTGTALKNEAAVTGLSPAGTAVNATSTAEVATVLPQPQLSIVKSADTSVARQLGQQITYAFTVRNTGNVTVSDIIIVEGEFSGDGDLGDIACPAEAALLAPTAEVTCHADYTVVAADLTGETLKNTATVTGDGPLGTVRSEPSTAEVKTAAPAGVLAATGSEAPLVYGAGAILLLLGGLSMVIARRKQTL